MPVGVINSEHAGLGDKRSLVLSAAPIPHIVLDDFLDTEFFADLSPAFEAVSGAGSGKRFASEVEKKKWISLNSSLPGAIRQVVDALNTEAWMLELAELTGLPSLVPTSTDNKKLANYHVMDPGAILGPHVDHASDPTHGLPHVLNTIVYLTEGWEASSGGATLFHDASGRQVAARIPYKANRALVFLHTPYSFHSVERVAPESKLRRRTIYVDYYSKSFAPYAGMNLDVPSHWFRHGTTFKLPRFRDYFRARNASYTVTLLDYHWNRFISRFG